MRKNILVFGLISGLVIGTFVVVIGWLCDTKSEFGHSLVLGYGAQLLALSFIFVGVRNFRDKYNQGRLTFIQALKIGLGITLVASTMYVAVWLVDYYLFIPDFMDKYAAHMIKEARDSGATQAVLDKKIVEVNGMKEMYKNPVYVILFTYLEILPMGIVISLVTALLLRRKRPSTGAPAVA
jgi:hypothetical protein